MNVQTTTTTGRHGTRYDSDADHVLAPVIDRLFGSSKVGYLIGDESYRFDHVGALAAGFHDAALRAGVAVGEPVAIVAPPSLEWIAAALGLLAAGAAIAPLDHNLTTSEIEPMLKRATISRFAAVAGCSLTGSGALVPTTDHKRASFELRGSSDDVAVILHTSGSTGSPKAVQLTHDNLVQSLCSFIDVFGCTGDDRTCIAVPLFHVTGLVDQLLQMAWLGGSCRLLTGFSRAALLESLVADEITVMFAVPTVFTLLLQRPPTSPLSLRLAIYGGAPIGLPTIEGLLELIPHVRPVQGYGMTEMTSLATALPFDVLRDAPTSVGVPSPITELRIVDTDGRDCAPHAIGEILMRGPHRTPGYRNDPEATKRAIDEDGWLHSGDLAWIDERGLVFLAGREHEIINRGGEKISPREIEAVLCNVEGVTEAAAFAMPDDVMYQVPAAAIVTDPAISLTDAALETAIEQHLAPYKRPVQVLRIDRMPLSASGKPDLAALRERLE
jgi:acyl-CoA synthetase (AMP-forming)/AMP-acid ligase II